MKIDIIVVPTSIIEEAQGVAPDVIGNDPRRNAGDTLALWATQTGQLTAAQYADLLTQGAQILEYDTAVGGTWQTQIVPTWVDPD